MLSRTSQIRGKVEETRVDLVKWIRKRWMGIRQEGGFDALEGWSIKEISQGGTYSPNFFLPHVLIDLCRSNIGVSQSYQRLRFL